MKSKAQTLAKWKKGVATGADAYKTGISNPRQAWGTATANAASAWETGVQQAVANGTFHKAVTSAQAQANWTNHSLGKGANRWQSSVNDSAVQAKYQAGLDTLYGYLNTAEATIANMPRGKGANNDARMLAFIHSVEASAAAKKAGK